MVTDAPNAPADSLGFMDALANDASAALRMLRSPFIVLFADSGSGDFLLAADRAGTRSPCYSIEPDRISFGLNARDVEEALGRAAAIRPQSVFDYFYFHVIPAPATIFEGIRRLLPGEYLAVRTGTATVHSYWEPRYDRPSARPDFARAKTEFRSLLADAVDARLGSGKTGTFLSGGTDSSTLAGMLSNVTGHPAHTYSIGFDESGFDEISFARIAARHFKTDHHEHYLTPSDLVASIPDVAASYDQPYGNSSVIAAYYCAKIAAQDGVTKLIGGDGGDEIFGGNTRYAKQKVFAAYDLLPDWLAHGVAEPLLLRPAAIARIPGLRKARSYIEQAKIPMPARLHSYNVLLRIGTARIFDPEFLRSIDDAEPAALEEAYYHRCDDAALVNRMLHFDWKFTLADNDLPKVVGACDLAGVATGFPLLDDRIVEFANRLPPEWKVKGLRLRDFFKRALADFLPPEIIAKKKHGFGLPFGLWLAKDDRLRKLATGSLESMRDRGVLRTEMLDELLGTMLAQHSMFYGELVWVTIMLDQWFAAHRPRYRFA